jgi:hypothetical protein
MRKAKDEQDLGKGVIAGAGAAIIGAVAWGLITYATGYQIGFMAVGVGFIVGYAVRQFGRGFDNVFGIAGAVLALVGCLVGNLFASCIAIANSEGMEVFDVISQLDLDLVMEIMQVTFSPMDLLFYGIAVYEGYKLSFRRLTLDKSNQCPYLDPTRETIRQMEVVNMSDKKMEQDRQGMLVGGLITLGIGLVFLLSNLDILPDIGDMWPMIPIIVGVSLIIGSFFKGKKSEKSEQSPN